MGLLKSTVHFRYRFENLTALNRPDCWWARLWWANAFILLIAMYTNIRQFMQIAIEFRMLFRSLRIWRQRHWSIVIHGLNMVFDTQTVILLSNKCISFWDFLLFRAKSGRWKPDGWSSDSGKVKMKPESVHCILMLPSESKPHFASGASLRCCTVNGDVIEHIFRTLSDRKLSS